MYMPDSFWTWAFTLTTLVQGLAVVGLEAYAFAAFQQALTPAAAGDQQAQTSFPGLPVTFRFVYTRTVPTFLALYIFAVIYQFVLTIDALRLRNIIQVIGLCFANVLLMGYGAVQKVQINDALHQLGDSINPMVYNTLTPIDNAVLGIFGGGTAILSFTAWKLYQEFAWDIYKSISADLRMKRRYLIYQVYLALLKFDFFFFLGYSVQWIVVLEALNNKDYEFPLTVVAVPVTIGILLLAALFVRRENIAGTIFVMVFYFAALAYFIFKLARIWVGDKRPYYQPVAKPMTTFAAVDIALILVTIGVGIKCALNFNKGLRNHLRSGGLRKAEVEEGKVYHQTEATNMNMNMNMNYPGAAPMPSRMTIE